MIIFNNKFLFSIKLILDTIKNQWKILCGRSTKNFIVDMHGEKRVDNIVENNKYNKTGLKTLIQYTSRYKLA